MVFRMIKLEVWMSYKTKNIHGDLHPQLVKLTFYDFLFVKRDQEQSKEKLVYRISF